MDARRLNWILRGYPRSWRARYADEVLATLEQHTITPRTVRDLLRQALKTRLDPAWWGTPGLVPSLQTRAAVTLVYAGFPLVLLAFVALANGGDNAHDNALIDGLQRSDPWMCAAQVSVMSGLGVAFAALLLGALVVWIAPLRRAMLAQPARVDVAALAVAPVAGVTLLGLLIVYAPPVAIVLLVLLFVPGVTAVLGLPLVPLWLGRVIDADGAPRSSNVARPPDSASRALLGWLSGLLALAVLGAAWRDASFAAGQLTWRLALYGVVAALPIGVLAAVARRPLAPPRTDADALRLTQLALVPAAVATLGLVAVVLGMLLSLARMWSLPLAGQHWRLAETLELIALAGIVGALLLSTLRAVGTATTARVR